jgi:hypothetical protein
MLHYTKPTNVKACTSDAMLPRLRLRHKKVQQVVLRGRAHLALIDRIKALDPLPQQQSKRRIEPCTCGF